MHNQLSGSTTCRGRIFTFASAVLLAIVSLTALAFIAAGAGCAPMSRGATTSMQLGSFTLATDKNNEVRDVDVALPDGTKVKVGRWSSDAESVNNSMMPLWQAQQAANTAMMQQLLAQAQADRAMLMQIFLGRTLPSVVQTPGEPEPVDTKMGPPAQ